MKVRCRNCGDPTVISDRTDQVRASLGWCPPCVEQRHRQRVDRQTGRRYWADRGRALPSLPWPDPEDERLERMASDWLRAAERRRG